MLAVHSDNDSMQKALDGKKLPSLPLVVQKLIAAVNSPNTEMRQLASLIEQDAGLAARILRLANSPFYGLSGEVGSIQQAVVVLGFHAISQLAASVGLMQAIKVDACERFNLQQFWSMSLRVALGARWLAQRADMNAEHAYLGGLLHDIGLPLMAGCFPQEMDSLLQEHAQTSTDLLTLEENQLGFNHLQLGVRLARNWNVPAEIIAALTQYRTPPVHATPLLTDTLHTAWRAALLLDQAADGVSLHTQIAAHVATRLAMDGPAGGQLLAELEQRAPEIDALISTAAGTGVAQ